MQPPIHSHGTSCSCTLRSAPSAELTSCGTITTTRRPTCSSIKCRITALFPAPAGPPTTVSGIGDTVSIACTPARMASSPRLRLGSGDDDCRHRASPLLALEPMLRISRGTHSCLRRIPIADGVGACTVRGRVSSDDPLIVVIDDDENLCRAVERVLLTAAYQVRTYTRATDYLAEADVI